MTLIHNERTELTAMRLNSIAPAWYAASLATFLLLYYLSHATLYAGIVGAWVI